VAEAVEWATGPDALARLAPEWEALPRRLGSPFLRHEWFACWWRAFGRGELRVCTVRRDGALAAALPLVAAGGRLTSAANRHTQLYTAVGDGAEAIAEALADADAAEVELSTLPADDPLLARLAARPAGRVQFAEPLRASPYVETRGSFDEFRRDRLSAETRRSLDRSRRRFERDHSPHVALVEAPADVERELEEAFALEAAGWKGRDGTAILSHADTARFFRELGRAFAEAGILRLSTARVGGRLVAYELGALDGGRLWSMKTSYDESLRRYSPGRLLRLATIERCFELGLETNEMLGADDPYKLSFASGTRPYCVFRSYRRAPLPVGRFVYRRHVRPAVKTAYVRYGGLAARMAVQRALVKVRS
jgi:CelD/BcsL family acetyltransferase involved in cellulose biosynthesis